MPAATTASPSPTPPPPPFHIAIVGGGLGGLALAIGLLKHNISLHIYEAAPVFSEIGAGVAFGPNSMRALGLIDQRVLDGYKKHATYNKDPERQRTFLSLRAGRGITLADGRKHGAGERGNDANANGNGNGKVNGANNNSNNTPTTTPEQTHFNPFDLIHHIEDPPTAPHYAKGTKTRSCIHRAAFLDELIQLIPRDVCSFNKALVSATQLPNNGGVSLLFADGTTAHASAVVGCDGIKSKTRDAIHSTPPLRPRFAGEYGYRAMVSRQRATEVLGDEFALNGQLYCGPGRYIITYPVEHAEMTNLVAIAEKPELEWDVDTPWQAPATREELYHDFEGWVPGVIGLIAENPKLQKWALFDLGHAERYCKGRICLLGDAAHATTPHTGAGAGMAMEDAFVLSSLVARARDEHELERAFEAYDAVRRPRTQRVIEYSVDAGRCYGLGEESLEKMVKRLQERFEWVWHEDLEEELSEAVGIMDKLGKK